MVSKPKYEYQLTDHDSGSIETMGDGWEPTHMSAYAMADAGDWCEKGAYILWRREIVVSCEDPKDGF